jgi:hypothetical protein
MHESQLTPSPQLGSNEVEWGDRGYPEVNGIGPTQLLVQYAARRRVKGVQTDRYPSTFI